MRDLCSAEECNNYAKYQFDVNLGVPRTSQLLYKICPPHLAAAILAGLRFQRERGDPIMSVLVEELPYRPWRQWRSTARPAGRRSA
ncbi:MAG TPA: hypothetical protein VFE14_20900 [Micromonosporaceae bacterium]|jgi:hypothetical protein|nr:hypothetical protein [Micromonosporaceae bacterium]